MYHIDYDLDKDECYFHIQTESHVPAVHVTPGLPVSPNEALREPIKHLHRACPLGGHRGEVGGHELIKHRGHIPPRKQDIPRGSNTGSSSQTSKRNGNIHMRGLEYSGGGEERGMGGRFGIT
jgi:hypothetical protein